MTSPRREPVSKSNKIASRFDVSTLDLDTLEKVFTSMAATLGLNGKAIFAELRNGQPLASALGIPRNAAPILYARAHSWFSIGRIDKATVLFRALCLIDPSVADHWIGYGVCLDKQGLSYEAEQSFERAVALRPTWAVALFHVMEARLRSGNKSGARAACDAFFKAADPSTPPDFVTEAERYRPLFESSEDET